MKPSVVPPESTPGMVSLSTGKPKPCWCHPATPAGDALVYGTSIASSGGMARTRPIMGVCPQFDVLWDELTGLEHLHVFAAIKGGFVPRVKG